MLKYHSFSTNSFLLAMGQNLWACVSLRNSTVFLLKGGDSGHTAQCLRGFGIDMVMLSTLPIVLVLQRIFVRNSSVLVTFSGSMTDGCFLSEEGMLRLKSDWTSNSG